MHPFWSIGFRPFYLSATIFALLAVPAWYGVYRGWLTFDPVLPGMAWHAHEMVFGFAAAVIGGFLLTAVRNWTGRPTPSGAALAALLGLWVAGRLLLITGPVELAVAVDIAFLPVLALVLAIPLWRSRNWRNLFVVPLLLALAALGAAHHGGYRGWLDPAWGHRAVTVALDLVALLLAVIGGRVIPAFSANAVAGLIPRRWPAVEVLAVGLLLFIALLDVSGLGIPEPARRGLFALAALAHLLRLAGWQPWATRGNPLLLALPLAYLWLPTHLLLRALLDPGSGQMAPLAAHALGIGAMAAMMLAMMTRSALGHTGRALVAGRAEITAFAAVHFAAATRALGPLAWPDAHQTWLALSALGWSVAFAAFVLRYAPMMARPRADDA